MDSMQIPEKSCPLIYDHNPGCFCADLNSQKIRLMVEYCMGDFEACPLYPQLLAARTTISGTSPADQSHTNQDKAVSEQ
jgi:hypothetical protein